MENTRTHTLLVLFGATPFIACALLPLVGRSELPYLGPLDALASSYALAIASFVAGSHWGIFLRDAKGVPINLFISSNVALLAAWFGFVLAAVSWQLAIHIGVFVFLWLVDRRLFVAQVTSASYFRLRSLATTIVCAALALSIAVG